MLCVNKEVAYNPISTCLAERHGKRWESPPSVGRWGVMVGVYQRFNFRLSIKKKKKNPPNFHRLGGETLS